jgi:hypothetical protein
MAREDVNITNTRLGGVAISATTADTIVTRENIYVHS